MSAASPSILVIRRDNIGDLVCATPLIAALRARYPDSHIAALVNSYNAAVLDGNPDLNAVHAYTKLKHRMMGESWFGILYHRVRLLRRLRAQRFDYVVLAKSGFDRYGLGLARQVRPLHIVGFAPDREQKARAIDIRVPSVAYAEMHEVEVMMQLAKALDVRTAPGPLKVFPQPERVAHWREQLARVAPPALRWLGLHISAREKGRQWPAERFVELSRALAVRDKLGIVLLWAPGSPDDPRHPGDDDKADRIQRQLGSAVPLFAVPTAKLEDLTAALALCHAFIGADGGALHIAAGLRLPIVALFENLPHKKRHWHPWHVPYELVCPPTRDISDITVGQVTHAWDSLAARLDRTA